MQILRVYVAGAWVEQHQRARPMIAKLREAGVVITADWTVAEGERAGVGDSDLSAHVRQSFATADLDGVARADLVWLLAANDKGACGSWVELGAALMLRERQPSRYPFVVVSGAKWNRSIFTELCDKKFDSDAAALDFVLSFVKGGSR